MRVLRTFLGPCLLKARCGGALLLGSQGPGADSSEAERVTVSVVGRATVGVATRGRGWGQPMQWGHL